MQGTGPTVRSAGEGPLGRAVAAAQRLEAGRILFDDHRQRVLIGRIQLLCRLSLISILELQEVQAVLAGSQRWGARRSSPPCTLRIHLVCGL